MGELNDIYIPINLSKISIKCYFFNQYKGKFTQLNIGFMGFRKKDRPNSNNYDDSKHYCWNIFEGDN